MMNRGIAFASAAMLAMAIVAAGASCSSFSSSDEEHDAAPPTGTEGGDELPPVGGPAAAPMVVTLQAGTRVELVRGKRTDVVVQVERREGFRGDAVITVRDLPEGVFAEPLTILAGEKLGTLGLTASGTVPHGLATPVLRASDRDNELAPSELKFDLVLRGVSGSLDETFGKKGVVEALFAGASFGGMASQPDGKLVYAGIGGGTPPIVVGRLQANGTPDTTFGGQGTKRFAYGAGSDDAIEVLSQPDGKVIVVGTAANENKIGLVRLTPSGALDTTFGGSGKILVGTLPPIAARLADDGSIFLLTSTGSYGILVGHVKPNGELDTTFGNGGWATIDKSAFPGSSGITGSRLALSPSSVVISCIVSGAINEAGIARIPRTGQGQAVVGKAAVGENTQYRLPLVIRSDGSVVLAFNSRDGAGPERMTLFGFGPDGHSQLPNFGGGNPVFLPADDVPFSMVEDEAQRLILAGQVDMVPFKFRLLRQLPQGAPDPAFGAAGVTATLVGDESRASSVVVQKDKRIVVGGDRTAGAVTTLAFARYWP